MPAPDEKSLQTKDLPLETREFRKLLKAFLDQQVEDPVTGNQIRLGNYKFGVYAFFDYDGEPIYVGQTNERLRVRIQRHLTNRQTDAVAMSVLDPVEVFEVEVWPLPEFDNRPTGDPEAAVHLNALEYEVFQTELEKSLFDAVLNEVEPFAPTRRVKPPTSYRAQIVSDTVYQLRSHPDVRIARRAATLARLALIISEREVSAGLRKTLLTQAKRLQWLAGERYNAIAKRSRSA
jgi:hypothetical protein